MYRGMVTLSVERINSTSPYKVKQSVDEGFVEFITDVGVHYSAGFDLAEGLLSYDTYQFYIVNVNQMKSPRDSKLRGTIMAIIYEFFIANNTAMLYLCEIGDEKQSMRSRLFEYWTRVSSLRDHVSVFSVSITDSEGVRNYASLILRLDHPYYTEIIAEFTQTVKLLNDKPAHA